MSDDTNMVETVQYLQERSQNIERYSDKLREEVQKFSKFFASISKKNGLTFYACEWNIPHDEEYHAFALAKPWEGIYVVESTYCPDHPFNVICLIGNAKKSTIVRFVQNLGTFLAKYAEKVGPHEELLKETVERIEKINTSL